MSQQPSVVICRPAFFSLTLWPSKILNHAYAGKLASFALVLRSVNPRWSCCPTSLCIKLLLTHSRWQECKLWFDFKFWRTSYIKYGCIATFTLLNKIKELDQLNCYTVTRTQDQCFCNTEGWNLVPIINCRANSSRLVRIGNFQLNRNNVFTSPQTVMQLNKLVHLCNIVGT